MDLSNTSAEMSQAKQDRTLPRKIELTVQE